jgi:hypothetical protein
MKRKKLIEYQYFIEALRDQLSILGWGGKASIAEGAGVTGPFISLVASGNKLAGFDSQVKIANACGYDYIDFLRLGRQKYGKKPGAKIRELSAPGAIKSPPEADRILSAMRAIRAADMGQYHQVLGKIETMAEMLPSPSATASNDR